MIPAIVVTLCLLFYFLGFKFYSRYLADKVFGLRGKEFVTPAHTHNDGIDYVPTKPSVLFGHHFASIAGLAPILGPAVAVGLASCYDMGCARWSLHGLCA